MCLIFMVLEPEHALPSVATLNSDARLAPSRYDSTRVRGEMRKKVFYISPPNVPAVACTMPEDIWTKLRLMVSPSSKVLAVGFTIVAVCGLAPIRLVTLITLVPPLFFPDLMARSQPIYRACPKETSTESEHSRRSSKGPFSVILQ